MSDNELINFSTVVLFFIAAFSVGASLIIGRWVEKFQERCRYEEQGLLWWYKWINRKGER